MFPPLQPPVPRKTEWRKNHRQIRGNSPKTRSRRSGCLVKMAFLKNTFRKERVRMTTWPPVLAPICEAICPALLLLFSCVAFRSRLLARSQSLCLSKLCRINVNSSPAFSAVSKPALTLLLTLPRCVDHSSLGSDVSLCCSHLVHCVM